MRVLIDGDDTHVWLPAGAFTIHGDGRVNWRTEYGPLRTHASSGDQDVHVTPRLEGALLGRPGVVDAAALDGARGVVIRGAKDGEPLVCEVIDLAHGEVVASASLDLSGPRAPGFRAREEWQDRRTSQVDGRSPRGVRLFPCDGGFVLTAHESGHVARFSLASGRFERVWRVPGAPENTVYAARVPDGLLIGMKWNGRHSEILHLGDDGRLVARWPYTPHGDVADEGDASEPDGDEADVRWGMPTPVVMAGGVLTYSDTGPHRKKLALLSLPGLAEIAHVSVPAWPADLHAQGDRFACVSREHVVLGHASGQALVVDRTWTLDEIMKAGAVPAMEKVAYATDDARGERLWVDSAVDFFAVDGGVPIVRKTPSHAVVALGPDGERGLIPSPVRGSPAAVPPSGPALLDARGGALLFAFGGVLTRIDQKTKRETGRIAEAGRPRAAILLPSGVFHVAEGDRDDDDEKDQLIWTWSPFQGPSRTLSWSTREIGDQPAPFAHDGAVWWQEYEREEGVTRGSLLRWRPGDKRATQIDVDLQPLAFAIVDDVPHVVARQDGRTHLFRAEQGGLQRLSREPLPYFVDQAAGAPGVVLFVEGQSTSDAAISPSRLHRFALATATTRVVATASFGELSHLRVADGRVHWLESPTGAMSLFGIGRDEGVAAACSVSLSDLA